MDGRSAPYRKAVDRVMGDDFAALPRLGDANRLFFLFRQRVVRTGEKHVVQLHSLVGIVIGGSVHAGGDTRQQYSAQKHC